MNDPYKHTACGTDDWGNRFCPGNHIAISTIWITAASILTTFNISKCMDKDGRVIEPSREYSPSIIRSVKLVQSVTLKSDQLSNSHPLPFECSIKPRSHVAEGLIRSVVDSY